MIIIQCGGTLLKEILLQWWGNHQVAPVVCLSGGYKEIEKPQCCKLLEWFEEKKAMGEARERTRMRGFEWDKLVTWWLYIGKWKGVNKNDNN